MPDDPYVSLSPDRAKAVKEWLSTPLGSCRFCGELVFPTDSRQRDLEEPDESVVALVHLPCLMAAEDEKDE